MSFQEHLVRAYSTIGLPLDQLPYSTAMDCLATSLSEAVGKIILPKEAWAALIDLRKRGQLPKVGRLRKSA